ncbi:SDR family NAD(P)-dependent oxidoreductase [Propylenella binzhouense]|nr:SDR family NAD(P)-dependent oxidoreductase [Propylenella binzhouense]
MTADRSSRRTALITGASHGIGAAAASALAADGYDVAVTDLDPRDLATTVEDIRARGARALPVALDIRSEASIEACFAAILDAFGTLDVLVNNAGVPSLRKPAVDIERADWDRVLSVNLTGTFFMAQAMGRHRIAAGGGGSIVNLASTHGLVGLGGASVYGIAKAGVAHMTRMLAIEWAPHRIRVNAVAPGATETKSRIALSSPQHKAKALARIPFGRYAEAGEVAAAIRYLAGEEASYTTGHVLVVDGGLTAA